MSSLVHVPHGLSRGGVLSAAWVDPRFRSARPTDIPSASDPVAVPPSHGMTPTPVRPPAMGAASFIDPDPRPHVIQSYSQPHPLLGIFQQAGPVSAPRVGDVIPTAAPEWVTYQERPRRVTGAGAQRPHPMGAWPDDLAVQSIFGGA